ncbi:MAG: ribonuclease H-like domain-containing protein [Planctomycetota bacterium]
MIEHTFIHLPGIGAKTERRMWRQGVTSLHALAEQAQDAVGDEGLDDMEIMDDDEAPRRPRKPRRAPDRVLEESIRALEAQDWGFFYRELPVREHWRLLPCFRRIAYLDIETTGLGPFQNHITTIGIYDGVGLTSYVHGRNLDEFMADIMNYDALVTFNGKTFDLPFIEAQFRQRIPLPHLDLRHLFHSLGYKGGLKKIETRLGLGRTGAMHDIDGFVAVLLWQEYANRGNRAALETLLAYNLTDVVNLKPLAAMVYNMHLPPEFSHLRQDESVERPAIPHAVDAELVARLARHAPPWQARDPEQMEEIP